MLVAEQQPLQNGQAPRLIFGNEELPDDERNVCSRQRGQKAELPGLAEALKGLIDPLADCDVQGPLQHSMHRQLHLLRTSLGDNGLDIAWNLFHVVDGKAFD